jgi:hypothetical protein
MTEVKISPIQVKKDHFEGLRRLLSDQKVNKVEVNEKTGFEKLSEFYPLEEVAGWFDLDSHSHKAVQRRLEKDRIPYILIGGKPRVRRRDIYEMGEIAKRKSLHGGTH